MDETGCLSYVEIHPEYYSMAPGHRGGGAMAAMVAMIAGMEPEPEPEHGVGVEGARFDSEHHDRARLVEVMCLSRTKLAALTQHIVIVLYIPINQPCMHLVIH